MQPLTNAVQVLKLHEAAQSCCELSITCLGYDCSCDDVHESEILIVTCIR